MAVNLHFRHKDSSLFSNGQTAGFIATHIDPPTAKKGEKGKSGATLYFTKYDIGNAYNDKMCLEDIENNRLVNGTRNKLEGRTYVEGDLFMNPKMEMYRLVKAEANSNYTYRLEYIGAIKRIPKEEDQTFYIKRYIDEITFEGVSGDSSVDYVTERCMVPVNRGFDSSLNDAKFYVQFRTRSNIPPELGLSVGDILTRNYYDVDSSAGVSQYETWNRECRYKVIAIGGNRLIYTVSLDSASAKISESNAPLMFGNTVIECERVDNIIFYEVVMSYKTTSSTLPLSDMTPGQILQGTSQWATGLVIVKSKDVNNYRFTILTADSNYTPPPPSPTFILTTYEEDPRSVYCTKQSSSILGEDDGLYHIYPTYEAGGSDWDSSVDTALTYREAYRGMYGIKFKPIIKFKYGFDPGTRYKFWLKIYLKNRKYFQDGGFSLINKYANEFDADVLLNSPIKSEPASNINNTDFEFYKCIEMPLINDADKADCYPVYISDYVADKLHPSGNNISVNYTPNPLDINTCVVDSQIATWSRFKISGTTYSVDRRKTFELSDASVNDELNTPNFFDQLYGGYRKIHPMIQYYKRVTSSYDVEYSSNPTFKYAKDDSSVTTINYRGGESAYFSGMVLEDIKSPEGHPIMGDNYINLFGSAVDSSFNQYVSINKAVNAYERNIFPDASRYELSSRVEYLTKEMVAREIQKFIFSPDNIYEIVCVDTSTGNSVIINKPLITLPTY